MYERWMRMKLSAGNSGLHVLEPEQRGDGRAVGEVHAHVFALAFEVYDFADLHQRDLVVGFYRKKLPSRGPASPPPLPGCAGAGAVRWLCRSS